MIGSAFNDSLIGAVNTDNVLSGGAGNDYINGVSGNNRLDGGAGADTLVGGGGSDVFVFGSGSDGDTVNGFENGIDTVDLIGGLTFADLTLTSIIGGVRVAITANPTDYIDLTTFPKRFLQQNLLIRCGKRNSTFQRY